MQVKITFSFLFLLSFRSVFGLNTPTNYNPQNGNNVAGYSTVLSAFSVNGATGYEFYFDSVSTLNSGWLKRDTSSYCAWSTPDLKVGKTYYWKLRAYKPGDTSAWSATLSFTITQPVVPYTLPATGTSGNIRPFTGSISGGTANITIQYEADTTALFNSPLHTFHAYQYYTNGFSDSVLFDFGRKIYWRARAWGLYGDTTTWSAVSDYTIIKQAPVNGSNANVLTDPQWLVTWPDPYLAGTEVQVDTATTFNTAHLVTDTIAVGIARDTLNNLMFGKRYYIRIRNTYAGKVSDWSATRTITVYSTYNFINPGYPGQSGYSYNGACSWNSGQGVRTQFQLSEDDQYTLLLKDTITNVYYYSYPDMLKFSKHYYVRIRMFHELDTTPWTNSDFIVSTGAPYIYGVNNNETKVAVRPHFLLRKETWATGYVMEIDTGKVYTASHSPFYIISDTFTFDGSYYHYLDTSLLYNQQYYARLYALKGDDTTGAGLITFKTASAPVNYFPPNNTIGTGTSTDGLVTGIKGSTYIQWQTDTSVFFSSPLLGSGVDPHVPDDFSPQYVGVSFPDYFKFHSIYYWRARCINPVDTGEWSAPFSFLTTQEVWGISPVDQSVSQPITPTLEWGIQGSASSQRYQYVISTDSGFAGVPVVTLPEDESSQVAITCQFATTYYWKARAYNPIDTSHWSKAFRFTTIPLPVVGIPTLQLPSYGASNITPGTVSLIWSTAANANAYEAEVASDENFTDILVSGTAASTGIYFSGAQASSRYYWRVRGVYNDNVKGTWATPFWFQTTPPVGIEETSSQVQVAVFPNPASNRVTIRSVGSFHVTITDLRGRTLKEQSGNDELVLETTDLNGGVYFIQVQSGEKMLMQKLVISH